MSKPNLNADFAVDELANLVLPAKVETAEQAAARIRAEREGGQRARALDGMSKKLEVFGDVPGFHLHIFKDDKNRVIEARNHGWSFVNATEIQGVGVNITSHNTDPGGNVRFVLGTLDGGEPMYGYLMKYPEELWLEDQQIADRRNQLIDQGIRRGNAPGETDADRDGRYIPTAGIKYDQARQS